MKRRQINHIQYDTKCRICGLIPPIQNDYTLLCPTLDVSDDYFVCDECLKVGDDYNKEAKINARAAFVGVAEVQKVITEAVASLQRDLAEISNNQLNSTFCQGYWQEQYTDCQRKINKLRTELLFMSPAIVNKPDTMNYELLKAKAKEYPIIDILESAGVKLDSKSGGRAKYLCPVQEEKTASFVVYLRNNTCHCFGCGFHSDSVGLFMKIHNTTFYEAIKHLGQI